MTHIVTWYSSATKCRHYTGFNSMTEARFSAQAQMRWNPATRKWEFPISVKIVSLEEFDASLVQNIMKGAL